mmetsp:Transcript_11210/g.41552  ORF Transcript_11210/g.41552 Transcript_11210/m.41552 type:complete len:143 (+) Transcript_11210:703-1131(+)
MMFASVGVPEIPAGGSFCRRLKSRIRRFRAGVLIVVCVRKQPAMSGVGREVVGTDEYSGSQTKTLSVTRTSGTSPGRGHVRVLPVRCVGNRGDETKHVSTAETGCPKSFAVPAGSQVRHKARAPTPWARRRVDVADAVCGQK